MGVVEGMSYEKYPKQGHILGKRVKVCFDFDTEKYYEGTCIRDDSEMPGECIFKLDNGRVVRSVECQYTY
jgi:hypothetical protein